MSYKHEKNGLEAVTECLKNATNINVKDNDGKTALMRAVMYSDYSSTEATVKLLIDAGADVNAKDGWGQTALMLAANNSNEFSTEDTVKMLIDAGADLNAKDYGERTALMHAAMNSNFWCTEGTVKLLIDAGADFTGVFEVAHKDKQQVLYNCIIQRKIAFGLGRLDPKSIVSTLPREICKVILDFVY